MRLHALLRRERWRVNHERIYRLYRDERLALQRRRPKRRRSAVLRASRRETARPNERWAMDFMQDVLADGQPVRVFTLVNAHTRECLALEAARRFRGGDVAAVLSGAMAERGPPQVIQCDQGTGCTAIALDQWANGNKMQRDFGHRGKPGDNAVCEASNGSVRRECLSQAYLLSYADAQRVLADWKHDYNNHRPHSNLQDLPLGSFPSQGDIARGRERALKATRVVLPLWGNRRIRTHNLRSDAVFREEVS